MEYQFKGTPAPWHMHHIFNTPLKNQDPEFGEWEHLSTYLMDVGNKVIGDIKYSSKNAGWPSVDNIPEFEANQHIIIAAPELLQACIMALKTLQLLGAGHETEASIIKASIHKALNIPTDGK